MKIELNKPFAADRGDARPNDETISALNSTAQKKSG